MDAGALAAAASPIATPAPPPAAPAKPTTTSAPAPHHHPIQSTPGALAPAPSQPATAAASHASPAPSQPATAVAAHASPAPSTARRIQGHGLTLTLIPPLPPGQGAAALPASKGASCSRQAAGAAPPASKGAASSRQAAASRRLQAACVRGNQHRGRQAPAAAATSDAQGPAAAHQGSPAAAYPSPTTQAPNPATPQPQPQPPSQAHRHGAHDGRRLVLRNSVEMASSTGAGRVSADCKHCMR
jgi:hypothetical protein